jgi:hypothetical protein
MVSSRKAGSDLREWQTMTHPLFQVLRMLDEARLWYRLERTREDTVLIMVTAVGERFEIDVFENGEVEVSRFRGNEDVESGLDVVRSIIDEHSEKRSA